MKRRYVEEVRGNIKGGVNTRLGPKTLIVGPVGSGKTSVTDVIHLALTGSATDIMGRETTQEKSLLASLSDGSGKISACVKLNDGTLIEWRSGLEADDGKVKHVLPDGILDMATVFPVSAVLAAIRGSTETARSFFLKFMSDAIDVAAVRTSLDEDLRELWDRSLASSPMSATDETRLMHVLAQAKKSGRRQRASGKGAKAVETELAQGIAPLPSKEEQDKIVKENKEAQLYKETLIGRRHAATKLAEQAARSQTLPIELENAQRNIGLFDTAIAEADTHLAQLQGGSVVNIDALVLSIQQKLSESERTRYAQFVTTYGESAIGNLTGLQCPVCYMQAPSFSHFYQAEQYAMQQRGQQAAQEAQLAQVRKHRDDLLEQKAQWTAYLNKLQGEAAVYQAATAVGNGTPPTEAELNAATAAAEAAQARVIALEKLKTAHGSVNKAGQVAGDNRAESDRWKRLHTAVARVVEKLLVEGTRKFEARVQAHLPPGDQFGIELLRPKSDGDYTSCFQVGLRDETGLLRLAISGGQEARVWAALAAACAPENDNKLRIILTPDVGLDADALSQMLTALANADAQVIICTTTRPAGFVPADWTVIDTGKGEHRRPLA